MDDSYSPGDLSQRRTALPLLDFIRTFEGNYLAYRSRCLSSWLRSSLTRNGEVWHKTKSHTLLTHFVTEFLPPSKYDGSTTYRLPQVSIMMHDHSCCKIISEQYPREEKSLP